MECLFKCPALLGLGEVGMLQRFAEELLERHLRKWLLLGECDTSD